MKKSKHDWNALIAAQTRSGQSIDAFCRTRGLTVSNFYAARQRLRQTSASGLIPIQLETGRCESISIEIKLAGPCVALRGSVVDLALLLHAL